MLQSHNAKRYILLLVSSAFPSTHMLPHTSSSVHLNLLLHTAAPAWLLLQVILTTNHGGKFSFRVCPRRRDLDAACFGSNYLTRCADLQDN